MLEMPDAIALCGLLATVTVGILRWSPSKNGNGYVRKETFDVVVESIRADIVEIKESVKKLLER